MLLLPLHAQPRVGASVPRPRVTDWRVAASGGYRVSPRNRRRLVAWLRAEALKHDAKQEYAHAQRCRAQADAIERDA